MTEFVFLDFANLLRLEIIDLYYSSVCTTYEQTAISKAFETFHLLQLLRVIAILNFDLPNRVSILCLVYLLVIEQADGTI